MGPIVTTKMRSGGSMRVPMNRLFIIACLIFVARPALADKKHPPKPQSEPKKSKTIGPASAPKLPPAKPPAPASRPVPKAAANSVKPKASPSPAPSLRSRSQLGTARSARSSPAPVAAPAPEATEVDFSPHIVPHPLKHRDPFHSGFIPQQIAHAYGFDVAYSQGYLGQGQTIAIVDAFYDPHIQQELNQFCETYHLPSTRIEIEYVGCEGARRCDQTNYGWHEETALDVQWAHALAPAAKILLIVALLGNGIDVLGVTKAVDLEANIVSMSWGSPDVGGYTVSRDFLYANPDVAFVASSGDNGANHGVAEYPATSGHVIAAGGTTLVLNPDNTVASETAWNLSGGGFSKDEPQPAYQQGVSPFTGRAFPDLAFVANPNTGVASYNVTDGWYQVGGTSVSAPITAAMLAVIGSAKGSVGQNFLPFAYSFYPNDSQLFFDIVFGGNARYRAIPGYDLLTGLGRPYVNQFVDKFAH
jgi:Subtilase family